MTGHFLLMPLSILKTTTMKFFALAVALLFINAVVHGSPAATHSTDFIPCSDPCNGGDVNYELVTSIRTFPLMNYTYRGRVYTSPNHHDKNNIKDDGNAAPSFMGPTMRVQPGQSLWIKLRNEMYNVDNGSSSIGPKTPSAVDYWKMLQNPGKHVNVRML